MKKIYYILSLVSTLTCGLSHNKVFAQSLPAGTPVLDEYYRRMQLLGKVDSNISFTIRPMLPNSLASSNDIYTPDSISKDKWVKAGPVKFANGLGRFQILPLTVQQQFNSDHPYGWNDGAMIAAKGYQTMVSGGIYFKWGPLSIQLRPEFVYATNPRFKGFSEAHSGIDADITKYASYLGNFIDLPDHYGNGVYSKAFLGQSNILLNFGPVTFGLSNENIWWGPGIHNALILSNNAPGFKHVTFNSNKPVKTFLGHFEWQILAGRLDASGFSPLSVTGLSNGSTPFIIKPDDWRYFTGFNLNYHPKWIPGLTLGLTRTFNAYGKDITGFSGYVPFFIPYAKQTIINGDPFPRDQYTSIYTRWLFAKAQAEIYFEYGLNDNSYNIRDFIGSPDHSRAYLFGLRKMIPISGRTNENILFGAEFTQISQSPDRLTREAFTWYIHNQVYDGHTNQGQVLGAGTGPGGNLQNVNISWVSGIKKLGISIERYEHSVDFAREAFPDIDGNSRKWVDFAFGLHGEWNYKNLLFNAKFQHVKSLNYQWVLKDYVAGQYYIPHNDVYNLHAELGVTFRF